MNVAQLAGAVVDSILVVVCVFFIWWTVIDLIAERRRP